MLFEQALAMEEDNGDSLMAYALFLEERLKDFAAAEQMYVQGLDSWIMLLSLVHNH